MAPPAHEGDDLERMPEVRLGAVRGGPERRGDLGPRRLLFGVGQAGHHLVQGAERLPFEPDALGGRAQPKRRVDPLAPDAAELPFDTKEELEQVVRFAQHRESLDELVALAHDYLVRFRPERSLDDVRAWAGELSEQWRREGVLRVEHARAVLSDAARYLKVRMRLHRFPGVKLTGVIEAAIKALHYEQVMTSIVRGGSVPLAMPSGPERPAGPQLVNIVHR